MKTLELNVEEQQLLKESLERSVRDLEMEIRHTDSHDFKDMLRKKKAALDELQAKLHAPVVSA